MSTNDRTRLSTSASDALEILDHPDDDLEGRTRETVINELLEDGFERADAEHAVDELHSKGYLYEVGEELYVTPF
jgi:hypothetical protein